MNKHTVTYRGRTFTRNSKSRIYSHVVLVVENPDARFAEAERRGEVSNWLRESHQLAVAEGERYGDGVSIGPWGWCGRLDLAEKQAEQARKVWGPRKGEVVIVEATLKAPKA